MPEYTRTMNDLLNQYAHTIQDDESDFFGESDLLLALWKRKEQWRGFGEGLSELMTMTGYTGGQDVDEKTAYIISALNSIGVNPAKSTVKDWFLGKRSPDPSDIRSRKKMFQLCFALHADKKQSEWFLNNVYLSRGFDYHRYEELIYEFCISRGLPYSEAEAMIAQVNDCAGSESSQSTNTMQRFSETMGVNRGLTASEGVAMVSQVNHCAGSESSHSTSAMQNFSETMSESRGSSVGEGAAMVSQGNHCAGSECSQSKYTMRIFNETRCFSEKELLIKYINDNRNEFEKWTISSSSEIQRLMKELQNEECRQQDEEVRETLKRGKKVTEQDAEKCSLLVRWIISRNQFVPDYKLLYQDFFASENKKKGGANDSGRKTASEDQSEDGKDFYGVQLYSTDYLLKTILGTTEGIDKKDCNNVDIPKAVTDSFPTKKNFSDILDDSKKVSYITVRKALIFIKFVHFWCWEEVQPREGLCREELCEVFWDETTNLLEDCGLPGLYVGNPYDWLFLYCSLDESPLDCLHNVITDVRNDQPDDKKGE